MPQTDDRSGLVTLALAGDVMVGRGVDQILPHPGDPRLWEFCMGSAQGYVALAEGANGPLPAGVDFAYVWGEALDELRRRRPDAFIVNLETAVTTSADRAPKGINYRMNPANAGVLAAAGVDACALANNHVLDWGASGLIETVDVLDRGGIKRAGAGRDLRDAISSAAVPLPGGRRALLYAVGSGTSGIPPSWAATPTRAGVNRLADLSADTARRVAQDIRAAKQPSDIVIASIHWGANWGYGIGDDEVAFAHALIDEAEVDVVHGHSSHHARPLEIHDGRPILYGCGDFLNDYEGIEGYEEFRSDLALLYFVSYDASRRRLVALDVAPFQIRKFRLHRAAAADAAWMADTLTRESRRFAVRVRPSAGTLRVEW